MVDIIMVNWNAGTQLAEAVSSIAQYHHDLVSLVIIVDNASSDDSLAQVDSLKNLSVPLKIIRNTDNRGFGAACNQGAALASSEYLLFLNPDTRLFDKSLPVSLAFMQDESNKDVGIVGIQLLDEQSHISRSCARFPTLGMFSAQALGINRLPRLSHLNTHMSDWKHDETRIVNHVIGAFYLMRRTLFNSLGGFDERFFVYLEDLDLSLSANQAGYRSVFLAEAQAFHAGGGTSRQVKVHRLFYSLRSRLIYGFKHFSPCQAWCLIFITLGIEPITRSVFAFMSTGCDGVRNTWRAYGMLWRAMGSIIKERHS
jgi:GT2 family glycosyltransferase